jgi:hypothetical protein
MSLRPFVLIGAGPAAEDPFESTGVPPTVPGMRRASTTPGMHYARTALEPCNQVQCAQQLVEDADAIINGENCHSFVFPCS